jgi:uncharacterized membrane protein YphA (DoxX/SURF4 family)
MDSSVRDSPAQLGRCMFAVAFIAFGFQQCLFGDLVPGRPPAWPPELPAKAIAVYASAVCYVVAGAAILAGRMSRQAALLIVALVLVSAVVRNVPLALAATSFGTPWTRLGKGIALCGGALAIAGRPSLRVAGAVGFGLFLMASGVQHFLFTDAVTTFVPAWIPAARFWTYFAGVALIAGGAGVIVPKTTRVAGIAVGLMVFTWFVVLHIPRALAAAPAAQPNEWIAVFEALAFAGIAFALTEASSFREAITAGTPSPDRRRPRGEPAAGSRWPRSRGARESRRPASTDRTR